MSIAETVSDAPSPVARGKASRPRPGKAKARRDTPATSTKAQAVTATAPKAASRRTSTWIAEYIYAGADGSALIAHLTIAAASAAEARAVAAASPPAPEFMVSIHPCSDEQILGQVRHRALAAIKSP